MVSSELMLLTAAAAAPAGEWAAAAGKVKNEGKSELFFRSSPAMAVREAEERLWAHEEEEQKEGEEAPLPLSSAPRVAEGKAEMDAACVAGAALCEQLSAYLEAQRVVYEQGEGGLTFDLWVDLLANKELFVKLAAVVAGLRGEQLPAARFLEGLFCALGASFFTRLVKVQDLAAALQGLAALPAEGEDAERARSPPPSPTASSATSSSVSSDKLFGLLSELPEAGSSSRSSRNSGGGSGGRSGSSNTGSQINSSKERARVEAQDWVWASETDEGLPFSLPENVQRFQCWPKELFLDEFEAQVNHGVVDLEGDELPVQLAEHIYCLVQRQLLGRAMGAEEEAALVRTVKELASLRGLEGTCTLSQLSALANWASRYASSL
jgi:hypothetical protein